MATITGYGSKHSHEFKLTVNETSTSVANNTSEVSFSFTIYKASYSWSQWNSITYTITINGTSYAGTIPTYSAGSTLTIRTGSQTIWHNNDGSKSISYSFSVTDNTGQSYTCGNASASGTLALTKIPRYTTVTNSQRAKTVNSISINWKTTDARDWTQYSLNGGAWTDAHDTVASDNKSGYYTISNLTPNTTYTVKTRCKRTDSQLWSEASELTIATYDIAKLVTVPNVNIGNAHTVTWSNPSGATISLKLCKTDNSAIIDYGTVTGTSKSITPTSNTIYALTPNSNTYKARYIITTSANGKSYTNSKDFTFTVTNSNPTFSNFTYQDTNATTVALTGNNQILVSGYSNVKATISTTDKAIAKNSATMKTYKFLVGNKNTIANYSSSADVALNINGVTSNTMDVYATDSRGNSTKVTKNATFKNYSKIAITSLTATRTNNIGTTVTLAFKATYWNNSFGSVTNAITNCIYKYKLTSASSYTTGSTTLTYSISGKTITGSLQIKGDLGADGFDNSNSYNIQLSISDKLSTATSTIILGNGNPGIAVYKNNVAIGQKYDTSEGSKLQVNGDISLTNRANRININGHKGILKHWFNDTQICANDGAIYFRPKGDENETNQVIVGNDGTVTGKYFIENGNNVPDIYAKAWTKDGGSNNIFDTVSSGGALYRSGLYTIKSQDVWYNLINVRHRNGLSDGINFGMQIRRSLASQLSPLEIRAQVNGSWTNWERLDRSKILYDNSSGTTGTITLSETSANFAYLEIFYGKSQGNPIYRNSTRINAPNGKIADLIITYYLGESTMMQSQSKCISISGTSLSTVSNTSGFSNSYQGKTTEVGPAYEIKIYKVIGYK